MLKPSGAGLGGLVVIIGALYFTGAGNWMLTRMQQLENQCYMAMNSVGLSMGGPVCNGVGHGVNAMSGFFNGIGEKLHAIREHFASGVSSSDMGGLATSLQSGIADMASPTSSLQQLINNGPGSLSGGNIQQQFQHAIDSFTIGQSFAQNGNAAQALPWLQQGARQPQGFGLMSQLSLGDLYRTGGNGVTADPVQSQAYYRLASNSISQLSASNSPQSQQMLGALPASPQAIQQQIAQIMASMHGGLHR